MTESVDHELARFATGTAQEISVLMPGERDAPSAVVVAGDAGVRRATALYLRLVGGYSVLATGSMQHALRASSEFRPALLLLYVERRRPWPALQLHAWRAHVGAPVIALVTDSEQGEPHELEALGAVEVVTVPVDPGHLMEIMRRALGPAAGFTFPPGLPAKMDA